MWKLSLNMSFTGKFFNNCTKYTQISIEIKRGDKNSRSTALELDNKVKLKFYEMGNTKLIVEDSLERFSSKLCDLG